MNPRRMILALVALAGVAAALWAWRESSRQTEVALTSTKAPAPLQDAFHRSSSTPAPASAPASPAPAAQHSAGAPVSTATPSDINQNAATTQVEPPNVDTPEPAERKFARGGRPDE